LRFYKILYEAETNTDAFVRSGFSTRSDGQKRKALSILENLSISKKKNNPGIFTCG
jgi:hypothetical protein